MALAFLEQKIDDLKIQLQRFRQTHTIRRRSARNWPSNPQRDSGAHRYYLRDGRVAVQNGDGFPSPHDAEVLAEASFQFRDPNLFHFSYYDQN